MPDREMADLEPLIAYIKRERRIDFASYKGASFRRRLRKRMAEVGVEDVEAYVDHLQASPDEMNRLLDTVFINVTEFFRDPEAWERLGADVIPEIVGPDDAGDPIRIWCAGVATGEEAFTVAMLLAEALGEEAFQERVKIFATDVDGDALATGRSGRYPVEATENLPGRLRERYFEREGQEFVVRPQLRRSVIFGEHDLIEAPPISRLDLLVCRNTLMYLHRETQNRILERFHFALKPDRFLFVGSAEMLLTGRSLFTPVADRVRIFRRRPDPGLRERTRFPAGEVAEAAPDQAAREELDRLGRAFDALPVAQFVLDVDGHLTLANEKARVLFSVTSDDIGSPFHDLEVSYRPVELRSRIERAHAEQQPISIRDVEREYPDGECRYFDVQVAPLHSEDGRPSGTAITLTDVTDHHRLAEDLSQSQRELESAYEDLQSSNEELETTNEELHSTVEELETTNEELQSTNEELETMNEELQSTNAELQTVNTELQERTLELNRMNEFIRSIVDSMPEAVVVLDRSLHVQLWNGTATEFWGFQGDEVEGDALLNLDIGLPVEELKDELRACADGSSDGAELRVEGHDRKGKPMTYRVECVPRHGDGSVQGVVLEVAGRQRE